MATGAVYSQPLTRTTQKAQRKKGAGGGDDDDDDADSLSTVSDKEDLTQQEVSVSNWSLTTCL